VTKKGEFLWRVGQTDVEARNRESPSIEMICSQEIEDAVCKVLAAQFGTPLEELVVQASRLLGFLATHSATADKIRDVIENLIEQGILKRDENGVVNLT